MSMPTSVLIVVLLCVAVAAGSTVAVFDAAMYKFITDDISVPGSMSLVCKKWFGDTTCPKPSQEKCGTGVWPDKAALSPLIQRILTEKQIFFGANNVLSNMPKRFNGTLIGTRNGFPYYKVIGYEADIGQSIADRIASHYGVQGGIQAYFTLTPWYSNATNNIIYNLNAAPYPYDAIISGLSVSGTWDISGNGTNVYRETLVDFTCPYQEAVDCIVQGRKPLPQGSRPINSAADLNQTGIVICVQPKTDLAFYTYAFFTAATKYESTGDIKVDTLNQICHAYLSPNINALWDAQNSNGQLLFIGDLRPSTGQISIAVRKEQTNSSASLHGVSLVLMVLIMLFSLQ